MKRGDVFKVDGKYFISIKSTSIMAAGYLIQDGRQTSKICEFKRDQVEEVKVNAVHLDGHQMRKASRKFINYVTIRISIGATSDKILHKKPEILRFYNSSLGFTVFIKKYTAILTKRDYVSNNNVKTETYLKITGMEKA